MGSCPRRAQAHMVAVMVEGLPVSSCCRWRIKPQASLSIALDDSLCLHTQVQMLCQVSG